MRSIYLRFWVYAIEKWPFSRTCPLIYGNSRSFLYANSLYANYFWSLYLSHNITRSTCTNLVILLTKIRFALRKFIKMYHNVENPYISVKCKRELSGVHFPRIETPTSRRT